MVTLKDVANKAGVSMSTASAAIRGKDIVKPETTQRVLEAANRLSYRTNLSARALRSGKSDIFTMIVPDLETQYYAKLANSMAKALASEQKRLIVQISQYDKDKERELVRQITPSTCDGVFICSTQSSGADIHAVAGSIPVLMFDDMSNDIEAYYDSIETPSQTGMYAIIKHLVECGRRKIGIVGTTTSNIRKISLSTTLRQNRCIYAYQAMQSYGLDTPKAYIQSDWGVGAGIQIAHDLVRQGMCYDALCCMNDELALGVLRGLAECGVHVPDDVAVTGFDGVLTGSYTMPTLSTVAVDFNRMARTAVAMMQDQIERDDADHVESMPRHVIVGFQLLKRESTLGRNISTASINKNPSAKTSADRTSTTKEA